MLDDNMLRKNNGPYSASKSAVITVFFEALPFLRLQIGYKKALVIAGDGLERLGFSPSRLPAAALHRIVEDGGQRVVDDLEAGEWGLPLLSRQLVRLFCQRRTLAALTAFKKILTWLTLLYITASFAAGVEESTVSDPTVEDDIVAVDDVAEEETVEVISEDGQAF